MTSNDYDLRERKADRARLLILRDGLQAVIDALKDGDAIEAALAAKEALIEDASYGWEDSRG